MTVPNCCQCSEQARLSAVQATKPNQTVQPKPQHCSRHMGNGWKPQLKRLKPGANQLKLHTFAHSLVQSLPPSWSTGYLDWVSHLPCRSQ